MALEFACEIQHFLPIKFVLALNKLQTAIKTKKTKNDE